MKKTLEGLNAMNILNNKGLKTRGALLNSLDIVPHLGSHKLSDMIPGYNSILVSNKIRSLVAPSNSLLTLKMLNDMLQKRLSELTESLIRIR